MSIILNEQRIGNFTSSEIYKLLTVAKDKVSFGKPALTYIKKKKQERRLGRSLSIETSSRSLSWGKLLEEFWFDQLSTAYKLTSDKTVVHPSIPFWAGSSDGEKKDTVIDIKSPYTLDSFCDLVDPLYEGLTGIDAMNAIRENHDCGEQYYQQLVSNSIIHNARYAELIVGMPYYSQLAEIKLLADGVANVNWIAFALDEELPFLLDKSYYKNINIIRFAVPQEDKDLLTDFVLRAGNLLLQNQKPSIAIAKYDYDIATTIVE